MFERCEAEESAGGSDMGFWRTARIRPDGCARFLRWRVALVVPLVAWCARMLGFALGSCPLLSRASSPLDSCVPGEFLAGVSVSVVGHDLQVVGPQRLGRSGVGS